MDEEEHLHRYGTPLDPLEKDEVPAKKPLGIEDQVVKDENGKRRFHGAFTGGFSAGFWNTVGSLEGWTPQNFKSSRAEKATPRAQQRPEDFMDEEDLGEFGIAPQGIRTRDEFAKESELEQRTGQRKRKLMQAPASGPIPGVPVLEQLLKPVKDKVAVRILKSMGWKPGQGVGPRQTKKEKQQAKTRNTREQYLLEHYGAEPKEDQQQDEAVVDADDDDDDEEDITFAPDDYEPVFYTPKENRFGMSYSGLNRDPILSKSSSASGANVMQQFNLFGDLETKSHPKKVTIRGQAFGVGAFEEEDEDIYARDDMTRYDFTLENKKPKQKKVQHVQQRHVIEGFSEDKSGVSSQKPFAIDLPRDFSPRNWLHRRSRFEPLAKEKIRQLEADNEYKKAGLGRHDLNPNQRAKLLGEAAISAEEPTKKNPFKDKGKSLLERITSKGNSFTTGGVITETGEEQPQKPKAIDVTKEVVQSNAAILEKASLKTKDLAPLAPKAGFKPFLADEAKQQRYEKFLEANLKDETKITEFLSNLQPVTLSLWDREMEKKEFIQAAKIYRPLAGLMYDRFVSEASVQADKVDSAKDAVPQETKQIIMERTKTMWKPSSLLCKRYNIAEPFGGAMIEPEKELKAKPKMSIFDYLETSINTKANFQTPTIIPKHIEKPKEVPPLPAPVPLAPPVLEASKSSQSIDPPPSSSKVTFVPKTALEKAVDESRDRPISEKVDLFKSIFDDSDEEQEEQVVENAVEELPEDKLSAMQAALGLPSTSTSSAAAVNILRNNSPPRGIFAALFKPPAEDQPPKDTPPPKFAPIEGNKLKISYKSREERLRNDKELAMADVPKEDLYGPKLPTSQQKIQAVDSEETSTDAKLQELLLQHGSRKRKPDQWVEKILDSSDDSEDDSDTDASSDSSSDRIKKSKSSKAKKSHKTEKLKKSKKSKQKSKKKSKKSDKTKHKSKKKKSKH
ncbi:uncharacterized protein Dwil_GK12430 [Drosophila willistoni]|uniref:G-patch domain-containing protein n=1 Tax=Drosophila willistoni TaxID=7260 RepID=B4N4P1_DROWI|nr:G patch domain-containing protein 1 homolog [Drosophila willistoni]EDW79115.1 uncharacterized protein Dwil_GK12430 [Drosophila willistoni]